MILLQNVLEFAESRYKYIYIQLSRTQTINHFDRLQKLSFISDMNGNIITQYEGLSV